MIKWRILILRDYPALSVWVLNMTTNVLETGRVTDREKGLGEQHRVQHSVVLKMEEATTSKELEGWHFVINFYFITVFICFSVLGIELRALQLLRKSLAWLQFQMLTQTNDCSSRTGGSVAPLLRILVQWTIREWMNAVEFVTALIRSQYSSMCIQVPLLPCPLPGEV